MLLIVILAGCGDRLQEPGGPVEEPTESAPLENIIGTWEGTVTSNVYDGTESAVLTVGPASEAGNHPADFEGQLVYCDLEDAEMSCYLFGTSDSVYRPGPVECCIWTGEHVFESDTYRSDSGTFTKQ